MEMLVGDPAELESASTTGRLLVLRADVNALSAGQDEIKADISELKTSIDDRFAGVDARFATVDQRFDAVDQRFDAVDQRFDSLNATIVFAFSQLGVVLPATSAEQLRLLDDGNAT